MLKMILKIYILLQKLLKWIDNELCKTLVYDIDYNYKLIKKNCVLDTCNLTVNFLSAATFALHILHNKTIIGKKYLF